MSRIFAILLCASIVPTLSAYGKLPENQEQLQTTQSASVESTPVTPIAAPIDDKTLISNFVQASYKPTAGQTPKPCALKRVDTVDGLRYLLAVCIKVTEAGKDFAPRIMPGILDLYVLKTGNTGALESIVKKNWY